MRTIFINRPHFLVPLTGLEPVRFLHRGILRLMQQPWHTIYSNIKGYKQLYIVVYSLCPQMSQSYLCSGL